MARRPTKQKTRKSSIPLDDALRRLLLYGESSRGSSTWGLYTSRHFGPEELLPVWEEHQAVLLAEWRESGESGLPWVVQFLEKGGNNGTKTAKKPKNEDAGAGVLHGLQAPVYGD